MEQLQIDELFKIGLILTSLVSFYCAILGVYFYKRVVLKIK